MSVRPPHETVACEKVLPGPLGGSSRCPSNSNEAEYSLISLKVAKRNRPSCVGMSSKLGVSLDQSCPARTWPVFTSKKIVRNRIGLERDAGFPICAPQELAGVMNVSANRSSSTK